MSWALHRNSGTQFEGAFIAAARLLGPIAAVTVSIVAILASAFTQAAPSSRPAGLPLPTNRIDDTTQSPDAIALKPVVLAYSLPTQASAVEIALPWPSSAFIATGGNPASLGLRAAGTLGEVRIRPIVTIQANDGNLLWQWKGQPEQLLPTAELRAEFDSLKRFLVIRVGDWAGGFHTAEQITIQRDAERALLNTKLPEGTRIAMKLQSACPTDWTVSGEMPLVFTGPPRDGKKAQCTLAYTRTTVAWDWAQRKQDTQRGLAAAQRAAAPQAVPYKSSGGVRRTSPPPDLSDRRRAQADAEAWQQVIRDYDGFCGAAEVDALGRQRRASSELVVELRLKSNGLLTHEIHIRPSRE